ncbi:MAG: tetratricopeptide repeat protein [Woeseiaceae bacterium]
MTVNFYLLAAVMVLVGFAAGMWPLLRQKRTGLAIASALLMIGTVVLMYPFASNFKVRSVALEALAAATSEEEARTAAAALAIELKDSPDNYEGWRLLGQSRLQLGDFSDAVYAFRRAMEIGGFRDPELKVLLGEAITYERGQDIPEEASRLFLAAYEEAPENSKAQWYAGLAFAALDRPTEAAAAWEALLAQGPPENVASILRERIAALRGQAATGPATGSIELSVSLANELPATWPETARLFVSVRNAEAGGPPLAARQYAPSSMPLSVQMDDRDAMIQGRNISSASKLQINARVSMSGDPLGGAGDYVGSVEIDRSVISGPLTLLIDKVSE